MDILNTKTALALGLSGAMSLGTATAGLQDSKSTADSSIVSVSSPDLRVTVYDGIATVVGNAESSVQAEAVEQELLEVPGIEYVINMVTWS
jgi:hypothetical protein